MNKTRVNWFQIDCFTQCLIILALAVLPASHASAQELLANPFDLLPPASVEKSQAADSPTNSQPAENASSTQEGNPTPDATDDSDETAIPEVSSEEVAELNSEFAEDPTPNQARDEEEDSEVPDGGPPQPLVGQMEVDDFSTLTFKRAFMIEVEGPIFAKFNWYLNQRLSKAKEAGADLVIVKLTTPGGDLEFSLELARTLRDIDWAKTVIWIPEEAISGGAILSFGADRIFMRQGALIGDAGPIQMGLGFQFEHAEEKIVSYLAGAIRELAESKGRPGALAEAMVDRNLKVYEATDRQTGETTYLTQTQVDNDEIQKNYEVGAAVPEAGQNRFLTLDADRATELGLVEAVYADEAEMLASLNIEALERTESTWVDGLVFFLNRPWVTAILLIGGFVGLYLEFAAPGISVAGLSALFCFGIFFWSHFLGGTSGWLEVMLFGLGVVCVICEIFVLPGFGVFGLTGLALLVLSLVMASQNFVIPEDTSQWNQLQNNLLLVLAAVLGVVVLLFLQVFLLDSIPGLNRFRLAAPSVPSETVVSSTLAASQIGAAGWELGMAGTADSDLRPSGKVRIADQVVDVVTEGDYVTAGTPVEIVRIEGNRITVRRTL
ncbi:MAG: NfeD family protein [Aureliella sp.]